jgi:hypothetical protein
MQIPTFPYNDVVLLITVGAIVLLILGHFSSYIPSPKELIVKNKKLKTVSLTVEIAFLVTVFLRIVGMFIS